MNEKTASVIEKEAEASVTAPVVIEGLQKASDYLEARYNLWRRRAVPSYAASAAEVKVMEKAAKYCLTNDFDPATYFQAQVDEIEGIEAVADYLTKDFYGTRAIERAKDYRNARMIRDKALLAMSR